MGGVRGRPEAACCSAPLGFAQYMGNGVDILEGVSLEKSGFTPAKSLSMARGFLHGDAAAFAVEQEGAFSPFVI